MQEITLWGLHGMKTLEHTEKHTINSSKQPRLTMNLFYKEG
jgi:hypothetical protein